MTGPRHATFAVITGGGTAGHVLPALAVAEALETAGHPQAEVHYVGARRGLETQLVPPTGLAHSFFDVVGLQRRFNPRNLKGNIGAIPKLLRARRGALALLRDLDPRVVVSVGGYASMPAVLAARRLRIPVVVVSYDRFPGRASAMSARFASACAVAFDDSRLPHAVVTGAPVRQEILDVDRHRDRDAARRALGVPLDRFLVVVTGGSQGSGLLNNAIGHLLDLHQGDTGLAVRHVMGERFIGEAHPATHQADGVIYQPVGYETEMALVYAAADLLVGRGGASTVHEVAATGTPAILVPWSRAAQDHQTANARWLADAGAAVLLPEERIGELDATIDRLRHDAEERHALGAAALDKGSVHRGGALAQLIESVALA